MGASHLPIGIPLAADHSVHPCGLCTRTSWLLWSACSAQRSDVIERGAQPVLFDLQVIAGLQVHPESLRGAEVASLPGPAAAATRAP